jgi:hypothetical protein
LTALYNFFRSVRLAVVLILIIALLSILGTLIPQGSDAAFYFHRYGAFWAQIILRLHFDRFFRSILFLLPVGLFFINLSVCTLDRLAGRRRRGARRRHGPDLIHIGLLVLIVGAMFSVFGRREGIVYMGEGDQIRLAGEYTVRLLDYRYEEYENGRPKDWISTVEVQKDGKPVIPSFSIEVNRPLRVDGIRVYQSSFAREDQAFLEDASGQVSPIGNGQGFETDGAMVIFRGIEGEQAVFERWEGHTRTATYRIGVGQNIGQYTVRRLGSREVTGLKAVKDPGFIPVIAALIVVSAGLALTLIQKRKDREI